MQPLTALSPSLNGGGPSSEKCGVLITAEFLPLMKEMSPPPEKVQNGVLTQVEKNKLCKSSGLVVLDIILNICCDMSNSEGGS